MKKQIGTLCQDHNADAVYILHLDTSSNRPVDSVVGGLDGETTILLQSLAIALPASGSMRAITNPPETAWRPDTHRFLWVGPLMSRIPPTEQQLRASDEWSSPSVVQRPALMDLAKIQDLLRLYTYARCG